MIIETPEGELVEIADDAIRGKSINTDKSWDFDCVGGPMHGSTIRIYKLGEPVTFGDAEYVMHPPAKRGGAWVYVHNRQETK